MTGGDVAIVLFRVRTGKAGRPASSRTTCAVCGPRFPEIRVAAQAGRHDRGIDSLRPELSELERCRHVRPNRGIPLPRRRYPPETSALHQEGRRAATGPE